MTAEETVSDLERWISARMADACTRIIMRQRSDNDDAVVGEWPLLGAKARPLAESLYASAESEVGQLRAQLLYGVFAYRDRQTAGRKFFSVNVESEGDSFPLAHHATRSGEGMGGMHLAAAVTEQLMRHQEALVRLTVGGQLDVKGFYVKTLAQRDARIAELESRYWEVSKLKEKLASKQHERDLQTRSMEAKTAGVRWVQESLTQLVPMILARMAIPGLLPPAQGSGTRGGPAAPGAPSAAPGPGPTPPPGPAQGGPAAPAPAEASAPDGDELLRRLMLSLSEAQMQVLLPHLRPEQLLTLATLNDIYNKPAQAQAQATSTGGESDQPAAATAPPAAPPPNGTSEAAAASCAANVT